MLIEFIPRKEYNYLLSGGYQMELLTTKEIAEKWGISSRRVTKLCTEGRVEGAVFKGAMWLIPDTTKKPEMKSRGRRKE